MSTCSARCSLVDGHVTRVRSLCKTRVVMSTCTNIQLQCLHVWTAVKETISSWADVGSYTEIEIRPLICVKGSAHICYIGLVKTVQSRIVF